MHLSPDGTFEDKLSHCQQQALKGIHNISIAPLSQEETYTAYCTMWRPSFKIPLPVTSLTKKQCKTLQRVFTCPFLAKMRISRTTSQALVFALVFAQYENRGFSIPNTRVQQELQSLLYLTSPPALGETLTSLFVRGTAPLAPLISIDPRKSAHLHYTGPYGEALYTYCSPHSSSQTS